MEMNHHQIRNFWQDEVTDELNLRAKMYEKSELLVGLDTEVHFSRSLHSLFAGMHTSLLPLHRCNQHLLPDWQTEQLDVLPSLGEKVSYIDQ